MVDAAAEGEIPKMVHPENNPSVDGEEQAMSATKVLDDDNLLREIILHVGFPTTLVRAALVCKRWLGHASDRKFLSRFHQLHPPRLLGYYITKKPISLEGLGETHFVPMMPQPPELAAVMQGLKSYNFGAHRIMQCRNGSVYTVRREGTNWTREVHCPLCAEKALQIIPPPPRAQDPTFCQIILKEEGSSMSCLYLLGEAHTEAREFTATACVYMLRDGVWYMHTSATCPHGLHFGPKALLVDNKIYALTTRGDDIIVWDLMASSFSTVKFPVGVKYHNFKSMLSRADAASSVYLIHVEEFQLRVWLYKGDNWLLVDTICLHEMLDTLGISYHTLENEGTANVHIDQVGDNGQFVFLRMRQRLFYLDIKCKTLCKVYEKTVNDQGFGNIHPFMMMWPPTFPALEGDHARNDM